MSATLRDTGLFTSRKRRSGDTAESFKQETKRWTAKKSRDAGSAHGRDAGSSFSANRAIAGAIAPPKRNKHVQKAIHKEVQYSQEGKNDVPEGTLQVFRFVQKAFTVPDDFEKNHKFGPLSGVSHEVRVVSAYMSGLLEARSKSDAGVKMCMDCGKKGHFPRHCPSSLLE